MGYECSTEKTTLCCGRMKNNQLPKLYFPWNRLNIEKSSNKLKMVAGELHLNSAIQDVTLSEGFESEYIEFFFLAFKFFTIVFCYISQLNVNHFRDLQLLCFFSLNVVVFFFFFFGAPF